MPEIVRLRQRLLCRHCQSTLDRSTRIRRRCSNCNSAITFVINTKLSRELMYEGYIGSLIKGIAFVAIAGIIIGTIGSAIGGLRVGCYITSVVLGVGVMALDGGLIGEKYLFDGRKREGLLAVTGGIVGAIIGFAIAPVWIGVLIALGRSGVTGGLLGGAMIGVGWGIMLTSFSIVFDFD
jgi:hypothetical protein